MNREDIEHMWKVASNNPNHDTNWHDPVVVAFAALVASAEREAMVAEAAKKGWGMRNDDPFEDCVREIADIRSRGNT